MSSEKAVQIGLDGASKQRTTLVVAHRLHTIYDSNQIFVMKGGEIIESGTHESLMKSQEGTENNGSYQASVTVIQA